MKLCPKCGKTYQDVANVCSDDNSHLTPLSTSDADPMVGRIINGRYRLIQRIAGGDNRSVYLAVNLPLDRTCAIRLLSGLSPRAIEMLKREVRMASHIHSIHALTIYDWGEWNDGLVFVAMELAEGKPLSRVIAEERILPIGRVINITHQIAEALAAAHELGITHRDLKPDNIMLTRKGENTDFVKVLDFGIAKVLADTGENLTQTGFVLGTPVYLSPEQLLGEELDQRSDVYSLATIVYEMVSGKLPFEGDNPQAIMMKRVTSEPIPLRAVAPSQSEFIERAVMAALQRNRDWRTSDIKVFAREIGDRLHGGTAMRGGDMPAPASYHIPDAQMDDPPMPAAPASPRVFYPDPAIATTPVSSPQRRLLRVRSRAAKSVVRRKAAKALATADAVRTKRGVTMTVWYGTNRRLDQKNDFVSYSSERDDQVHVGKCHIYVPESHKIGSIGSSWWKRLLTWKDDRLKVSKIVKLDTDAYWEEIRKAFKRMGEGDRRALIYIHGFNVTFEDAALRAAQLGCDLGITGIVAFYSWPSKGTLLGYEADSASIEASEDFIANFLATFASKCGADRVHVIAHSMGNRGLLRAMHRILGQAQEFSNVRFGQVFLAAPDIDRELFLKLAHCYPRVSERTTLYISDKDRALKSSGILHDFPRAGFAPPVTIVPGIDTVEVSNIDLTLLGHGFFANARVVLQDMHNLIMHNAPPDRRMGLMKNIPDENVAYWSIKA